MRTTFLCIALFSFHVVWSQTSSFPPQSASGGADTLVIAGEFNPDVFNTKSTPKVVVLRQLENEPSWKKVVKILNSFNPVPELILEANELAELPASFKQLKTERLSLYEEFSLDQNQAVDIMLKMPALKVVHLEVDEFQGISTETKPLCTLDSIYLFNTPEQGDKVRDNHLHLTASDANGKPRSIPVLYREWYSDDATDDDGFMSSLSGDAEENSDLFGKTYLSFAPPIPWLDVPRVQFRFSANSSREFTYSSGTRLSIPANAFVDANGKPLRGQVDVQYREFRNPLDCMLSGIPMGDNTKNDPWYFESGGMMELTASQNGEEVFLAPDKEVKVDFVTTNDSVKYDLFAYDDSKALWVQQNTTTNTPESKSFVMPAAVAKYKNSYANFSGKPDTLNLQQRWESADYYGAIPEAYHGGNAPNHIHLVNIKRAKNYGVSFMLANSSQANPELAGVRATRFAVDTKMNSRQFRKNFGPKAISINDIRLSGEGSDVTITLKTEDEYIELKTTAIREVKRKHKRTIEPHEFNFKQYNKALGKRSKRFNRMVKTRKNRLTRIPPTPEERHEYAYAQSYDLMSAREKCMNENQWKTYADSCWKFRPFTVGLGWASDNMFTKFSIASTGVYNCDIKSTYPQNESVIADYVTLDNHSVYPTQVYALNTKKNSCIKHTTEGPFNVNKLFLDRQSRCTLIALGDKNKAWLYTKDQYNNDGKIKKYHTFTITEVDLNTISREELHALIGY